MHERQFAAEPPGTQLALQLRDIAAHQRLHVGIRAGRVAALVFPQLRHHVGRNRHGDIGERGAHDRGGFAFVRRISVGVEEADRDRLDALRHQPLRHGAYVLGVERRQHVAVAIHPFANFQAMAARHQRIGELQEQIVDVVALLGSHLQNVAEAACGDQAEARAAALDQRIRHQRCAVHDIADVGQCHASSLEQFSQSLQRAYRWILRRCQALVQPDFRTFRIQQDEIGESSADVETNTVARGAGHSGILCERRSRLCLVTGACSSPARCPARVRRPDSGDIDPGQVNQRPRDMVLGLIGEFHEQGQNRLYYFVGSGRCGPIGSAASMRSMSSFDRIKSPAPAFSSACRGLDAFGIVSNDGRRVRKASAT